MYVSLKLEAKGRHKSKNNSSKSRTFLAKQEHSPGTPFKFSFCSKEKETVICITTNSYVVRSFGRREEDDTKADNVRQHKALISDLI